MLDRIKNMVAGKTQEEIEREVRLQELAVEFKALLASTEPAHRQYLAQRSS